MTTSSRKEAQQSLLSFLAAVPAAALVVWATFSLTHFVVWACCVLPLTGSPAFPARRVPPLTRSRA